MSATTRNWDLLLADMKRAAEDPSVRFAIVDAWAARLDQLEADLATAEAAAEEARQETARLSDPEQWTADERKRFLFGATKASYAEGTRAGCEELSIAAAEMSVELEQAQSDLAEARQERDRAEAERDDLRESLALTLGAQSPLPESVKEVVRGFFITSYRALHPTPSHEEPSS